MLNNALHQRKSKTCEQYMGQKVKLYRLKKKIFETHEQYMGEKVKFYGLKKINK